MGTAMEDAATKNMARRLKRADTSVSRALTLSDYVSDYVDSEDFD